MSAIVVASCFCVCFAALAVHPLLTYRWSLRLFARKRPPIKPLPIDGERVPLAICLCAYNEARSIGAKIDRLIEMAARYGPATVHVYDDCSADGTADVLRTYQGRIDAMFGDARRGKTHGMNRLVERSTGELILFTDANVISETDAALELARPFADPTVGLVSAKLVYSNKRETPTSALGARYWAMEEAIKDVESDTVGLIGCDGAMFMIRRTLHRPPPDSLIDDLYVSLSILISGHRLITSHTVQVQERSATDAVEEKNRKQRIACQAFNVHRALWPELRRMPGWPLYGYVSHRLLKWTLPFLLFGLALSGLALCALAVSGKAALLMVLAGVAIFGLGQWLGGGLLGYINSAIFSLIGVGQGIYESVVLNKQYAVWEPAKTVRD